VALWLVTPIATVKREVKGGRGEQFELLLVIIDDLEEPSDLVWLRLLLYNRSTCIKPTLFYVFWWMSMFSLRNYRKIMSIFVF
jgi:hypothetical protein